MLKIKKHAQEQETFSRKMLKTTVLVTGGWWPGGVTGRVTGGEGDREGARV